ncbi:hypothetical protein [Rhizobium mesoamericanum]|uniref:hypothetical protein n=1 Tax=Rhizobium mesoamericanum TaxID=1079800 RepID=UPI001F2FE2D8|nr:hypothetical protein [Rhizobium mesoamericanum]
MFQKTEIAVIAVSAIDGRRTVFACSPTPMDIVDNDALMRSVLREDQGSVGQTMLADGSSSQRDALRNDIDRDLVSITR